MPTFLSAQRSKANLLACSDTDSDEEESRKGSSAHPSADWQKLQATLAAQNVNMSSSSTPPPPSFPGARANVPLSGEAVNTFWTPGDSFGEFYVPTTGFDRDLSALSVGDFEPQYTLSPCSELRDRQAMPPPANRGNNFAVGPAALTVPPPVPLHKEQSDQWEDARLLETKFRSNEDQVDQKYAPI